MIQSFNLPTLCEKSFNMSSFTWISKKELMQSEHVDRVLFKYWVPLSLITDQAGKICLLLATVSTDFPTIVLRDNRLSIDC